MITIDTLEMKSITLEVAEDNILVKIPDKFSLTETEVEFLKLNKPFILGYLRRKSFRIDPSITVKRRTTITSMPLLEWVPEIGCIGHALSFLPFTAPVKDNTSKEPSLILAAAMSTIGVRYYISPANIPVFLDVHRSSTLILDEAPVCRTLLLAACNVDLLDWVDGGLILDLSMLEKLLVLAETGSLPEERSLPAALDKYLKIVLPPLEGLCGNLSRSLKEGESIDIQSTDPTLLDGATSYASAAFMLYSVIAALIDKVCSIHSVPSTLLLGHDAHLKAAMALDIVSKNGLYIDAERLAILKQGLDSELNNSASILKAEYEYAPGKGSAKRYQSVMADVEKILNVTLPRTATGRISASKEDLIGYRTHPFIDHYLKYKHIEKQLSTFVNPLVGVESVHTTFDPLVSTGRVSSSNPNIQQIPREGDLRSMFVPPSGNYFLTADYKMIELCALAQICLDKYGESAMADLINADKDLHRELAAKITGKLPEEVTLDERNKAKVAGFGFPGGLGISTFIDNARESYGVIFSTDEARAVKEVWFDTYPEMRRYMSESADVLSFYGLDKNPFNIAPDKMLTVFNTLTSGNISSKLLYTPEVVNWVWGALAQCDFPCKEKYKEDIANRRGTDALSLSLQSVATVTWKTGMIKTHCAYCQSKNAPFQGLVAAGAKLALYRLVREGFRVVNFIHDEFIIEVPVKADHLAVAHQVEKIMIEEMAKMIPTVKLGVDYALMERWEKGAKAVFDNPVSPTTLLLWQEATSDVNPPANQVVVAQESQQTESPEGDEFGIIEPDFGF